MADLIELDKQLLNNYQKGFPVSPAPFAAIAEQLGTDEETVIRRLEKLKEKGFISRIGPVFRPNGIGVSTLAALSVAEDRLTEVADIISRYDEVNHNYEREHEFNLWFVITAKTINQLDNVINDIEKQTGLKVLKLPMLEEYHIDLGFNLQWQS